MGLSFKKNQIKHYGNNSRKLPAQAILINGGISRAEGKFHPVKNSQHFFLKSEKKLAIASNSLVILTLGQGASSLFKETNFSILKNQNWKKIDIRCVYYNLIQFP